MSEQENKPEPLVMHDRGHEGQDSIMLRRAIKEGWPVTPEIRKRMVERSVFFAEQSPDHRAGNQAVANIMEMDKRNKEELAKAEAGSVTVTKTESVTLSKEQTYTVRFDGDG